MKASLQLKLNQSLTMTPQLQQAIKLLQLSTIELQQEIQNMLESNPMLEQEEADPQRLENSREDFSHSTSEHNLETIGQFANPELADSAPRDLNDEINNDPSQNTQWENGLAQNQNTSILDSNSNFDRDSDSYTLEQHLNQQLDLSTLSHRDKALGVWIIESVNSDGYLSESPEDLTQNINSILNNTTRDTELYEIEETYAVLHQIQNFDPPGVAAQDLKECLSIQLRQLSDQETYKEQALLLVGEYMDLLGNRDLAQLRRKTKLSENSLKEVLTLIRTLNPFPGNSIQDEKADYIIPDLIIKKRDDIWYAELNEDSLPKIHINHLYASYIKRPQSNEDKQYLREHLQEAKWFLKSLNSRHETLLRVAQEILDIQQEYFNRGPQAMKPLVLNDIAERLGLHESTISRVTNNKYMLGPKGVLELKYFFSSHVATNAGGECSSTAIRALIKTLISEENPKKPLSDNKLSKLLADQGLKVARRTVAKYRELESIPPSNERKQLLV